MSSRSTRENELDETLQGGKSLYAVGETPPLGYVPEQMHAWVIRRDRHGPPEQAMQQEVVAVPEIDVDEVLILVKAAGVNYNGVWAALGLPLSVLDVHGEEYHIAGSDAAGIVWKVGRRVTNFRVGDEVVVHCNQDNGDDVDCNGGDPMNSPSQRIWGYETADGAFAQFTKVQARQLMPKPQNLDWAESACYTLTLATAYRMLLGHQPHTAGPGKNVLVWGASGGLGSMAIQLCKLVGANAIGVISDESKRDYVMGLGAAGVINRRDFDCWGSLPSLEDADGYKNYLRRVRKFGAAIWKITGKGVDVDMVFEHPGEQTFPVSTYVVKRGGMVVFCGATTGYNLTMDARFMWMRQKRVQGSHFATLKQASEANQLVAEGRLNPCLSQTFGWDQIPQAHTVMADGRHLPGNMAVLIGAEGET